MGQPSQSHPRMSRKRANSSTRDSISGADASSSYDDIRDRDRPSSSRSKSSSNTEPPLSAYWVKFFKSAGFPSDVATRHALVFSNNRIKPDMLPDLDKPSLKEMGITLMGDMIAILRYAKKVVDETTCKKFLVSSEDSPPPVAPKPAVVRPAPKKVVAKTTKGIIAVKVKTDPMSKVVKAASTSSARPVLSPIKKTITTAVPKSKMYSDYVDLTKTSKPSSLKRQYDSEEEGINGKWVHNETVKRQRLNTDNTKFRIIGPKLATNSSQKILKKALETKRTVFHRLGDSMVSSTTSESHSNFDPTFNITGIGSEYSKRNSSVFNRLGNIDKSPKEYNRHVRNGDPTTQGILKTRMPLHGTKTIITKTVLKKPVGTMRADEEATRKAIAPSMRHLVKTTRNLTFGDGSRRSGNIIRRVPVTGKLASERIDVPAKSRLGVSKQVTFNKMTTINHIRKQGVFSRLGV
ncbi:hypothetical protein QAD02_010653 [Eretmocerus hayati]|uniref:Uncharacterized protein n=1 Tax=Eretmocerus hayati TaxID=131215 RepID=A0ACC2NUV7_9HYME|nr:hypothetical protein QAD02_010653 [Eretmocerus hayati]